MLNNLFSCAIKDPEHYSQKSPKLDIREYFNGNIEAYGVLKDWKGEVKPGKLGDIAPTILAFMGIPIPSEMTGNILAKA